MKSPGRSTYIPVVALLLSLILLAGLILLLTCAFFPLSISGLHPSFSIFQPSFSALYFFLHQPAFLSIFGTPLQMKVRQIIAAGVLGLVFLALVGDFVRRCLRNRLAKRQESGEAEIRPEALAMAYRHKLMAQLNQLKVMDVADPLDLETSYIPLRVRERPGFYSGNNEAAVSSPLSSSPRVERSKTLFPQEALVRFRHLALLGEPGAGKTTLLRHLAFQAAQGKLEGLPDFPILISLSHFAATAPQTSLLDFVIREIDALYNSSGLRSYLEQRLEEGSVLLLLDGLDETRVGPPQEAEATYRHVVGQINVLSARYPQVPIVVTSRRTGWKGLLAVGFHTLDVLKLEQDDIQRFIEDWFGRGSDWAGKLRRIAPQSLQLRAMAANPLLLSLMTFVFEQDGELPEGQARLYERGMELLLEKWGTHRRRRRVSRFTAEHQRELLKEVALHFHPQRLLCFPEDELSRIITHYLSAVGLPADWAPTVLERASAQYGLLKEQAPRWYSFPHLTWQEYFAAAAISTKDQLELVPLRGDVSDSWWWEGTILFLAGMLEDATPFLKDILNQEDDVFCSNLLLAGRCLARKPRLKRAELRESTIEWLQDLVEAKYHLPLRRWAIGVLAEMGNPSIVSYFLSLVTAPPFSSSSSVGRPEGEDWAIHRWVTTALASLGDHSVVTHLLALLSDQEIDPVVRTNVAFALGSLSPSSLPSMEGTEEVVPQLLALLPDEEVDYRVRMAVAEALGFRPEHGRDESVVLQFLRLLPNEEIDCRVRMKVAEALGTLGTCPERRDGSITSPLLRLLRDERVNYNVRMTVAETLGALGDKSISCRLLAVLAKRKIDPDVRASVAAALGPLGDKSVVPQLLDLLPNERIDPSIRWRIIDALGALGAMDDEATVPELLDLLANERIDSSVRVTVAEAMGEKTVTPRLPTPIPVGREAAKALRSLGDRSRVPQLLALLSDKELHCSVRLKIVEALGALGDDRITAEGLAALLDDEEIGSDAYQALFLVSRRIEARVFAREGGRYEVR